MKKGKTKGFTPFETPHCAEIPFCISPNSTNNHCKGQTETQDKTKCNNLVVYDYTRTRETRTHARRQLAFVFLIAYSFVWLVFWLFGIAGLFDVKMLTKCK